ncbi:MULTISPECIES: hypothetical protein [Rhodococcus]|uniref:hypothetical protein n=1 Tax=Rhodococcus TaxID=1827 RepID=UPI0018D2DD1A|nr:MULTISPECIES: hypothetical protein [Rhodococcus]MCE4165073.1 hypothetical protein [Rhodococcus sp. Ni2]
MTALIGFLVGVPVALVALNAVTRVASGRVDRAVSISSLTSALDEVRTLMRVPGAELEPEQLREVSVRWSRVSVHTGDDELVALASDADRESWKHNAERVQFFLSEMRSNVSPSSPKTVSEMVAVPVPVAKREVAKLLSTCAEILDRAVLEERPCTAFPSINNGAGQ